MIACRFLLVPLLCTAVLARAENFDYGLHPAPIAEHTYVLEGRTEDFNFRNGGNIVNTAFIVTDAGVVVIDSGPSRRYGEQLARAIGRVTDHPILRVFNTHAHPDHFLGNQAFDRQTLYATAETRDHIRKEGNAFAENMYRLNGDWMADTEVELPTHTVTEEKLTIGGHLIELLPLAGHSGSDLALYDHHTGTLFAGDLVFHQRAPTTPHARLPLWLASLDRLEVLTRQSGFKRLVPGHGPVTADATPIQQTRRYLLWLQTTLKTAADRGEDMTDVMRQPKPEEFRALGVVDAEFRRSVGHLFPAAEQEALSWAKTRQP